MPDLAVPLAQLRRPRLLIRAARFGLSEYRRTRDLRRLVNPNLSPEATVRCLMTEEDRLEQHRLRGDIGYSVAQHIEVLTALLAEARLLPQPA